MTEVHATSFTEAEANIRTVRDIVFGKEQHVPREIDWDGNDENSIHVIALDAAKPVGTGRLMSDGRIGRLAVLSKYRGRGIGARLLTALIAEAQRQDLSSVFVHSQVDATGFYEKAGFKQSGGSFWEAGIPHITMVCKL